MKKFIFIIFLVVLFLAFGIRIILDSLFSKKPKQSDMPEAKRKAGMTEQQ